MDVLSAIGQPAAQNLFGNNTAALGKDDFLKILVTQLRNQDPTDPMQADEFAVQLAQFSSVEQLNNISATLENNIELDLMLNQMINNTMATTFIGKQARAAGNTFQVSQGQDSELHYSLAEPAKRVRIHIRDASGELVRTINADDQLAGNQSIRWDGKDENGKQLKDGVYSFSLAAEDFEGNSVAAQPFILGVISSVRYENGTALLRVGGVDVELGNVIEISGIPDNSTRTARAR